MHVNPAEYRNNFVRVQVISQSASINCTFLNALKEAEKSCNAMIIYGETCQDKTRINGMKDGDNVVIINVRSVLEDTIYCSFIVNATANARTVIVEGNLLAISITTPSSNRAVITAVVPTVVVAITLIVIIGALFIILYYKGHREQYTIGIINQTSTELPKFKIILVHKESNMIEFARMNIENYDPDSGKGYYQLTEATEEYISSKTQVVLISEDEKHLCVGPEAQKVIGICDKRQIIRPDLSNTKWKYVFIQSNSRVRKLPKGSYFMFYGQMEEPNGKKSPSRKSTPAPIPAAESETLKIVGPEYYTLYPVSKEYEIPKFVETIKGLSYKSGLGYGFYQFTKPELISYDKQVILMGKDNKLYYGPDTRQVIDIACQSYDESKEIYPPNFEDTTWKCAFIQTRSNVRVLQPNTYFLYCTIASPEKIKVTEPHKMFTVPDVDEDERKLIKFATKNIPYYNPRAGYAYYEFTGQKYIIPDRNIMALSKKGELFTGPGVRNLIGAYKGYDETREIPAPDLSGTEWRCIFIQGKRAYGRVLEPKTQFLYCEYDYSPEVY